MSSKIEAGIEQTSRTTGTGDMSLSSVSGEPRDFSDAFSTGGSNVFRYHIFNDKAEEWEAGLGHLKDASTLVRDEVTASSNSGSKVDFSSGTKLITCTMDAGEIPDPRDGSSDQVWKSDGTTGSWSKDAGGIWTKDGELNSNVQNQVTYSMNSNYDKVKVFGKVYVDSSTGNNRGFDISMRVNNDSGSNYKDTYIGGGATTKDTCFRLISGDDGENVQGPVNFIMDGRWNQESLGNEYWTMNNLQPHSTRGNTDNERFWVAYSGSINNGSPLTQFTFLENRNDHDIKVQIKVFGMELP